MTRETASASGTGTATGTGTGTETGATEIATGTAIHVQVCTAHLSELGSTEWLIVCTGRGRRSDHWEPDDRRNGGDVSTLWVFPLSTLS